MATKLEKTHAAIVDHMAHIGELFHPGAKITVVVRSPHLGTDADIIVTDDKLAEVINSLAQAMDRAA